ncbi:hypothetical protein AB0C67_45430, partial [Streptomyces sp. NPDC048665]
HALLYQGGARAIPQVLYQAASIDGAGTVRQFEGVDLAAGTPHRDAIVPPSTVFTPTTPTRGPKGIAIWRYNGHEAVGPDEARAPSTCSPSGSVPQTGWGAPAPQRERPDRSLHHEGSAFVITEARLRLRHDSYAELPDGRRVSRWTFGPATGESTPRP